MVLVYRKDGLPARVAARVHAELGGALGPDALARF